MKRSIKLLSLVLVIALLATCVLSLAACNDDEKNTNVYGKTVRYSFDFKQTSIMADMLTGGTLDMFAKMLFNTDECYFEFKEDGTCHGQLQTKAGLIGGAAELLESFGIDLDTALATVDISTGLEQYAEPFFPGFTKKLIEEKDLKGALDLVQEGLGLNITGLDYSNANVQAAIAYVAENKTLPSGILNYFPADTVLTLTFDEPYRLETLTTYDGQTKEAIYLGQTVKDNPKTAPFGVFTVLTNEDGTRSIALTLEVVASTIVLNEVA